MTKIPNEQKSEIISLIKEGKATREQIAMKFEVSPKTIDAIKAHITMGTYADLGPEEVIDAMETTFGLEKDLQTALRSNIGALEEGLKVIDKGKEQVTDAGRIDITAEDKNGNIVIIELKAGEAPESSITQILSYIGAISEKENKHVRGILVAGDFPSRVIFAARAVPNIQLKKYTFKFSFEAVK